MAWVAVIGAGGAIAGGLIAKSGNKAGSATTTQQQQIDPRIAGMLFGDGTDANKGMLSRYQGLLDQPQSAGINTFGRANDAYLGYQGTQDFKKLREAATGQVGSSMAAPQMQAASVNAPKQNGMDLTGSYDRFINGDAGANPYLTKAIQGSIDQSTNQFSQMQGNATDNLMRNIMPGIRSNSVIAGQYGGSRQGIAEGNAIGDFAKAQQQTINQFGQNNTNAAVGAQAQSFNQGQDRALAATQGLGAQQYGVASQNASMQQGANQANLGAQQATNGLNASVQQNGMSNLNGLLGSAQATGQNQDAYGLNRAGQVNGLLSPYVGLNGTSTSSQPLYQNTMGNMLGGATAGLGLYNQFKNSFGSGSGSSSGGYGGYGGGVASSGNYDTNDWFAS
jgi:hypothetical protein